MGTFFHGDDGNDTTDDDTNTDELTDDVDTTDDTDVNDDTTADDNTADDTDNTVDDATDDNTTDDTTVDDNTNDDTDVDSTTADDDSDLTTDSDRDDISDLSAAILGEKQSLNGEYNSNHSTDDDMRYFVKITLINMWAMMGLIVVVNICFYFCYCRKSSSKRHIISDGIGGNQSEEELV